MSFKMNNIKIPLKSKYIDIVYELHGAKVSTLRVHEISSGVSTDYKVSNGGQRVICHESTSQNLAVLGFTNSKDVEVKIISVLSRKDKQDFLNLSESKYVDKQEFESNKKAVMDSTKGMRPYVQWFVTWKCNYKCSYCWQEVTEEVYRTERHNVEKVDAWAEAFNAINPIELYFTGGEPTLYKDITLLISKLNTDIHLSMTTNFAGSFILKKWFEEVPIGRMANVCASVHPTQIEDVDGFFDKAKEYIGHYGSSRFGLEMVNHPSNTAIISEERLTRFCEDNDIKLSIDEYTSVFDDEDENQEGTDRDLYDALIETVNINPLDLSSLTVESNISDDLSLDLPKATDSNRLPVFCPAGSLRVNVDALGDVYTCMSAVDRSKMFGNYALPHYKPLGNVLDGTFKILQEPTLCWEKFRCSACDYQRVGSHWKEIGEQFDRQLPICE